MSIVFKRLEAGCLQVNIYCASVLNLTSLNMLYYITTKIRI